MLACSTAAGVHWAVGARQAPASAAAAPPASSSWHCLSTLWVRLCISPNACSYCALVRICLPNLLILLLQCFPLSLSCLSVCVPSSACPNQLSVSRSSRASASVAARSAAIRTSLPFLNTSPYCILSRKHKNKQKRLVLIYSYIVLMDSLVPSDLYSHFRVLSRVTVNPILLSDVVFRIRHLAA